jgi:hypothetical protein
MSAITTPRLWKKISKALEKVGAEIFEEFLDSTIDLDKLPKGWRVVSVKKEKKIQVGDVVVIRGPGLYDYGTLGVVRGLPLDDSTVDVERGTGLDDGAQYRIIGKECLEVIDHIEDWPPDYVELMGVVKDGAAKLPKEEQEDLGQFVLVRSLTGVFAGYKKDGTGDSMTLEKACRIESWYGDLGKVAREGVRVPEGCPLDSFPLIELTNVIELYHPTYEARVSIEKASQIKPKKPTGAPLGWQQFLENVEHMTCDTGCGKNATVFLCDDCATEPPKEKFIGEGIEYSLYNTKYGPYLKTVCLCCKQTKERPLKTIFLRS